MNPVKRVQGVVRPTSVCKIASKRLDSVATGLKELNGMEAYA